MQKAVKRFRVPQQLDDSACLAKRLGLFLAHTFFLWMFFTAGGLERLAELGLIAGAQEAEMKRLAFEFAAQWRHGMTWGWPLYMPGFFVTAIAVWFGAYGLTWRKVVIESAVMMALAVLAALMLSRYSTSLVVDAFQSQTGLRCARPDGVVAWRVIGQGLFTLINWSSFVAACQLCLTRKSFRPLLLPAGLSLLLIYIRPFTADEFTTFWVQQIREGEFVAIFSALLIPTLAALFLWTLPSTRMDFRRKSVI